MIKSHQTSVHSWCRIKIQLKPASSSTGQVSTSSPVTDDQSISLPDTSSQPTSTKDNDNQLISLPDTSSQSTSAEDNDNQLISLPDTSSQSTSAEDNDNQLISLPDSSSQPTSAMDNDNQSISLPDISSQLISTPDPSNESTSIPDNSNQADGEHGDIFTFLFFILFLTKFYCTPLLHTSRLGAWHKIFEIRQERNFEMTSSWLFSDKNKMADSTAFLQMCTYEQSMEL